MKKFNSASHPGSELSFWQMTMRIAILALTSMAFIIFFLLTIRGIFGIME